MINAIWEVLVENHHELALGLRQHVTGHRNLGLEERKALDWETSLAFCAFDKKCALGQLTACASLKKTCDL